MDMESKIVLPLIGSRWMIKPEYKKSFYDSHIPRTVRQCIDDHVKTEYIHPLHGNSVEGIREIEFFLTYYTLVLQDEV